MDGTRLDFAATLNCIIGGRGSGKTTVLEALRYALDALPGANLDRERHRRIESLLRQNLGGGMVVISVETAGGTRYIVERAFGEKPRVLTRDGQTAEINIGRGNVFGADIYSQNEIEDIANDHAFQLRLLDRFIRDELREVEEHIRATAKALSENSARLLRLQTEAADLTEAITDLPDIEERLKELQPTRESPESDALRKAHAEKVALEEERQHFTKLGGALEQIEERLVNAERQLGASRAAAGKVPKQTPNADRVRSATEVVIASFTPVAEMLVAARASVHAAKERLDTLRRELQIAHDRQVEGHKKIFEQSQAHQVRDRDRDRLIKRRTELLAKRDRRDEVRATLEDVRVERDKLRQALSEFRDARYEARKSVAARLNKVLNPMIRVGIEQFGSTDDYHALLTHAMKGSGLRYANLVDKIVDRIPPAALVEMVQGDDHASLAGQIGVEEERAARLIIQLKDRPELYEIEVVELHDRPVLELQDGDVYKEPHALSTGQKCTVILPILLVETDRPLLIDQPEDNLDNAFVFDTILPSIRAMSRHRQLLFVTHNPNIPVLGDAERVFALRSTGSHATVVRAGNVDETATEIISILEGGRAAFEARRKRYGKPIPETRP